jgi:hypothetical protein|tara:strand:- start:577 stop:975 length:399 start_codon:yes stop_codon:yes gene_type:complete
MGVLEGYKLRGKPKKWEPNAVYFILTEEEGRADQYITDNNGIPKRVGNTKMIEEIVQNYTLFGSNGTIDKHYVHEQGVASSVWTITHNMDKKPSAIVTDSAGTIVLGEVKYTNKNELTIKFNGAFSGEAFLN